MLSTILSALATSILALLYGLFLGAAARVVRARVHGRIGPRLTQNYWDLWKLFRKKTSIHHGTMFWLAPMFRLTGGIGVLLIVPLVIGDSVFVNMSFAGDLLLVVYFMFFGCLGMALGASDSGHPSSVIAVTRGLSQMSAYELSFSVVVLTLAAGSGTLSLERIVELQQGGPLHWNVVRYPFATVAALIAFLPMMMTYPFNIVLAPQEIPIGPPTEYSSRFLSLMMSGRTIFAVAKVVLFMNLFFGGASGWIDFLVKSFLLYMYPVFVGSVFPRWRTEQSVRFLWLVPTTIAAVDLARVMVR